jgi:DNA-binding MarR family transcriptional regulator
VKSSQHRLGDRVVWQLARASQQWQRLARRELQAANVRTQYYHVLASLADDGAAAQAALADRISFDRSDLVSVLDELERLGHVVRQTDPTDRRRKIVAITSAGEKLLSELHQRVLAAEARWLEPLSAAERKTLLGLLSRLAED